MSDNPQLDLLRETLNHYEVRIELSMAFLLNAGGSTPCAAFQIKDGSRWSKVKLPLIVPPDGGSRGDLLRMFADLLDEKTSDAEQVA